MTGSVSGSDGHNLPQPFDEIDSGNSSRQLARPSSGNERAFSNGIHLYSLLCQLRHTAPPTRISRLFTTWIVTSQACNSIPPICLNAGHCDTCFALAPSPDRLVDVGSWQCAPKARITGREEFHTYGCRQIRLLASGLVGNLARLKPRDLGRLAGRAIRGAVTRVISDQSSKVTTRMPTLLPFGEGRLHRRDRFRIQCGGLSQAVRDSALYRRKKATARHPLREGQPGPRPRRSPGLRHPVADHQLPTAGRRAPRRPRTGAEAGEGSPAVRQQPLWRRRTRPRRAADPAGAELDPDAAASRNRSISRRPGTPFQMPRFRLVPASSDPAASKARSLPNGPPKRSLANPIARLSALARPSSSGRSESSASTPHFARIPPPAGFLAPVLAPSLADLEWIH